jgi:hypothetical protein
MSESLVAPVTLSLFSENAKHELVHPVSGEPTGLVLELVSIDDDNMFSAKVAAAKSLRDRKIDDAVDVFVDLDTKINVCAAAVVGWEVKSELWRQTFKSVFQFEDESFSKEKVLAVLKHSKSAWIRNQIDAVLAKKDLFFPAASNA